MKNKKIDFEKKLDQLMKFNDNKTLDFKVRDKLTDITLIEGDRVAAKKGLKRILEICRFK